MTRDWMVRKTTNELLGPMTVEEIREWIQSGKLDGEDELCSTGDYWFFVHEGEEVKARLGVEVPQASKGKALEATQAITKTMQTKEVSSELPELRAKPRAQPPQAAKAQPPNVQPQARMSERRRGFEGVFLWKVATFVLAFGLIVVTAKVFLIARPLGGTPHVPAGEFKSDPQKTGP